MFNNTSKYILDYQALNLLNFWYSDKGKKNWLLKDELFINTIREKFFRLYTIATEGGLDNWVDYPEEALALIILLDQVPRCIYHNTPKAYESDQESLVICRHAIACKYDYRLLNKDYLRFLYMPLMHSESISDQQVSIQKFAAVDKEIYEMAKIHHDIINKFGRFPQRNDILGRTNTEEEIQYLAGINFIEL